MSIISMIAEISVYNMYSMYTLAWFMISCGFTFVLAAAFFGYPKEITEVEYNELSNRE